MTNGPQAQFSIGQLVEHRLFGYRGAIFDVDPVFLGDDDWYEQVARSRPPQGQALVQGPCPRRRALHLRRRA